MSRMGVFFKYKNEFDFLFIFQATAEANNLAAVAGAKDTYIKSMEQVNEQPQLNC